MTPDTLHLLDPHNGYEGGHQEHRHVMVEEMGSERATIMPKATPWDSPMERRGLVWVPTTSLQII